jgi:hypothetical protein
MTGTDDPERKLADQLQELSARFDARTRGVVEVDFIREDAVEHWQKDGVDLYLCLNRINIDMQFVRAIVPDFKGMECGTWNGYARFPKLPGILPGYKGIYTYVPVHGGITFFQEWGDGSCTYGFDTGNSRSNSALTTNKDWMMRETESLARGVQIAARFERYYLAAGDDNRKKARVLDRMGKFLPIGITDNLGIMLNLLGGEL